MWWIAAIVGGLYLFSKGTLNFGPASATVSNQATGSSLSTALGSQAAPPSYYAIGNPGYNASGGTAAPGTPPPPIAAIHPTFTQTKAPSISAPPQVVVNPSPTQINNVQRGGAANRFAPVLVQPVNIRTRVIGPETATAFWTRPPVLRTGVFSGRRVASA